MAQVMVRCPNTGEAVPTGMDMDRSAFDTFVDDAPPVDMPVPGGAMMGGVTLGGAALGTASPGAAEPGKEFTCASCGQSHRWRKADAWLEGDQRA